VSSEKSTSTDPSDLERRDDVLEFSRDDREQTARLTLRIDGQDVKTFGRSGRLSLAIAHDGEIDEVPGDVSSLASWVAALLRLRSSKALEIRVPQSFEELRSISHLPHPDGRHGGGWRQQQRRPVA
jgi:hypothetical protein